MMAYFNVIIPTYNAEKTIVRALESIARQTFTGYTAIMVDDRSTDETVAVAGKMVMPVDSSWVLHQLPEKRWNGGARNAAMELARKNKADSFYTLFLDADDDFVDTNIFQELHDFIEAHGQPDMVRLPYIRHNTDGTTVDQTPRLLAEQSLRDVAHNCRVAAWTKAVKTSLLVPFPENTLMEDVCQHLKQVDAVSTFATFPRAAINWRIHDDSTSHDYSPKWKSSAYRFVADLMDLDLEHDYCRERRDVKIAEAIQNLREGRYEQ